MNTPLFDDQNNFPAPPQPPVAQEPPQKSEDTEQNFDLEFLDEKENTFVEEPIETLADFDENKKIDNEENNIFFTEPDIEDEESPSETSTSQDATDNPLLEHFEEENANDEDMKWENESIDLDEEEKIEEEEENHSQAAEAELKKVLYTIKDNVDAALRILNDSNINFAEKRVRITDQMTDLSPTSEEQIGPGGEKILEGVFDGAQMIGPDGQNYPVPPNYASKSKLVEGDILKLTITKKGALIYKQIKQVDRDNIIGELVSEENGHWIGVANGKPYKLLTASITFYKGQSGDKVLLIVPKGGQSNWAAVESVVKE